MEIDQIKQHPDSVRFFTDRVRLRREGKELLGLCCFHSEKSPSFRVWQESGIYLFKCFGCGSSGNCIQFVEKHDKIPFNAALKLCREQLETSWEGQKRNVEQTFKPLGQDDTKLKTYPESDYKKLEAALVQSPEAISFLKSRGISLETVKRLRLGLRPDVGQLAGSANLDISGKGWISFPSFGNGLVTSVKYRSICRKAFCKQPGMGTYLWNTGTIDFLEPVLLVEGELDACVLEQAGIRAVGLPNATTTVKPEWKDALLSAECVILAGDSDAAGEKIMSKLWADMPERSYMLRWPAGMKDANETLLKHCKGDYIQFRTLVEELVGQAKSRPMRGVYNVQESLMYSSHRTQLVDHPDRLRLPWPSVDKMAVILPGTVTTVYSSESGLGKSTLVLQASIYSALKHGETVVNYQAEMSEQQINTIITSHVLKKHRLHLDPEDFKQAARILGNNFHYYIGRNTSLTKIEEVLDLMEAAAKRFSATVVVLDNLHFLCRNEQDQVKAQANAMQRITNMAGNLSLKFIVVHQARKADQQHKRKVTHVSDLDGSKAVQNDSTTIYSIHRDEMKNTQDDNNSTSHEYSPVTEIRLQKARDKGEGGAYTKLMFVGEICTFSELAGDESFMGQQSKAMYVK